MGNHARVYTLKDLVENGIYENMKIRNAKKTKVKELTPRLIRSILWTYLKMKILQALKTGLPIKTPFGIFCWSRRKSRRPDQVIVHDKGVEIIQKRDEYSRSLALKIIRNDDKYRVHYERSMRTYLKEFLDSGHDIPYRNIKRHGKELLKIENYRRGGKYYTNKI